MTRLEYFKNEIIKILDRQEQEDNAISKSIECFEYVKSLNNTMGTIQKSQKMFSTWKINGKDVPVKKIAPGKWVRVYTSQSKGAEQTIARLKNKVRNCKDVDELFDIIMNHTNRFIDNNGKLLPIVEQLKFEVDVRKTHFTPEKEKQFNTLLSWVNEKQFNKAKGKTKEQIYQYCEDVPKAIATLPIYMKTFFRISDLNLYTSEAHMIDHMVNHHPHTPLPLYKRFQYILDSAKEIYFDTLTKSIVFTEQYGEKKGKECINFLIIHKDKNEKLAFQDSFYDSTKGIKKKMKKISLADIQQGLTLEKVEHTFISPVN